MSDEKPWYHGVKWGYRPSLESFGKIIAWNVGPLSPGGIDVFGTAKDDEAIAKLFAAAPETATERDQLKARVAELEGVMAMVAHHITRMNRVAISAEDQGQQVARDCLPLFEKVGMSNEGDGWGFSND